LSHKINTIEISGTFVKTRASMSSEQSSSSGLKTLSRNALYATLDTYVNDGSTKSSKVSPNLKEKSLYAFMQAVSGEYHSSHTSLGLENGANNGGRGLKARNFEAKLGQRALTLIKGGVGTSIVKSTPDLVNSGISGKRKKELRNEIIRIPGSISRNKRRRCQIEVGAHHTGRKNMDGTVLLGLHKMWEKYAKVLLQKCMCHISFDAEEASSLIATGELVGAFVKIKSSDSCKSHVGKEGYIVEITKNTWRIAVPLDKSLDVSDSNRAAKVKVILLPKKGSSLVLHIQRSDDDNESIRIEIVGNV
jgi:RNase P/RNase MRP subunit p29